MTTLIPRKKLRRRPPSREAAPGPARAALAASSPLASGLPAPDPGAGLAYATQAADLTAEYAAGGLTSGLPDARQVLSRTTEEVAVDFGGDRLWELMENDPTCSSALAAVVLAAVPSDVRITPVKEGNPDPDHEPDPEEAALVAEAQDAADLCLAATAMMETPAATMLLEMAADALKYGSNLAELVYKGIEEGEYKGLLGMRAIKPKPRRAWQFVVDPYNNVVGYLVQTEAGPGFVVLPPEKFFVTAWGRRKGDPRGRTVFRPAFNAWNILTQLWPEFFYFLQRFASPGLVGTSAPDELSRPATSNGVPIPGAPDEPPEPAFLTEILKFQKGKAIALPHGADLKALETKASGDAFKGAIDLLKREMTQAIILAVRATMESQHGSKADSETAQDMLGLVINGVRNWLSREYRRQVLYQIMLVNRGKEVADRSTPNCSLGDASQEDKGKLWEAYGYLVQSNAPLTRSQHIKLQVMVGIPAPEPGEEVVDMTPTVAEGTVEGDDTGMADQEGDNAPPPPPKRKEAA